MSTLNEMIRKSEAELARIRKYGHPKPKEKPAPAPKKAAPPKGRGGR